MATETKSAVTFELQKFNPRRLMRGAEAASVIVRDGECEDWLWMSLRDVQANIKKFGPQKGLLDALEHYRTRAEFPARTE